eukprot:TRINITY_DN19657_c0_g1_i1.p1 TRINITY_DN19657_c0_g1~~TRINITY_DN19657_c0_g1_i1.p1  ORF type:complete len:1371 (+),score=157.91 TRINITY_DN19657_c0_g1_i1:103-4215(+)
MRAGVEDRMRADDAMFIDESHATLPPSRARLQEEGQEGHPRGLGVDAVVSEALARARGAVAVARQRAPPGSHRAPRQYSTDSAAAPPSAPAIGRMDYGRVFGEPLAMSGGDSFLTCPTELRCPGPHGTPVTAMLGMSLGSGLVATSGAATSSLGDTALKSAGALAASSEYTGEGSVEALPVRLAPEIVTPEEAHLLNTPGTVLLGGLAPHVSAEADASTREYSPLDYSYHSQQKFDDASPPAHSPQPLERSAASSFVSDSEPSWGSAAKVAPPPAAQPPSAAPAAAGAVLYRELVFDAPADTLSSEPGAASSARDDWATDREGSACIPADAFDPEEAMEAAGVAEPACASSRLSSGNVRTHSERGGAPAVASAASAAAIERDLPAEDTPHHVTVSSDRKESDPSAPQSTQYQVIVTPASLPAPAKAPPRDHRMRSATTTAPHGRRPPALELISPAMPSEAAARGSTPELRDMAALSSAPRTGAQSTAPSSAPPSVHPRMAEAMPPSTAQGLSPPQRTVHPARAAPCGSDQTAVVIPDPPAAPPSVVEALSAPPEDAPPVCAGLRVSDAASSRVSASLPVAPMLSAAHEVSCASSLVADSSQVPPPATQLDTSTVVGSQPKLSTAATAQPCVPNTQPSVFSAPIAQPSMSHLSAPSVPTVPSCTSSAPTAQPSMPPAQPEQLTGLEPPAPQVQGAPQRVAARMHLGGAPAKPRGVLPYAAPRRSDEQVRSSVQPVRTGRGAQSGGKPQQYQPQASHAATTVAPQGSARRATPASPVGPRRVSPGPRKAAAPAKASPRPSDLGTKAAASVPPRRASPAGRQTVSSPATPKAKSKNEAAPATAGTAHAQAASPAAARVPASKGSTPAAARRKASPGAAAARKASPLARVRARPEAATEEKDKEQEPPRTKYLRRDGGGTVPPMRTRTPPGQRCRTFTVGGASPAAGRPAAPGADPRLKYVSPVPAHQAAVGSAAMREASAAAKARLRVGTPDKAGAELRKILSGALAGSAPGVDRAAARTFTPGRARSATPADTPLAVTPKATPRMEVRQEPKTPILSAKAVASPSVKTVASPSAKAVTAPSAKAVASPSGASGKLAKARAERLRAKLADAAATPASASATPSRAPLTGGSGVESCRRVLLPGTPAMSCGMPTPSRAAGASRSTRVLSVPEALVLSKYRLQMMEKRLCAARAEQLRAQATALNAKRAAATEAAVCATVAERRIAELSVAHIKQALLAGADPHGAGGFGIPNATVAAAKAEAVHKAAGSAVMRHAFVLPMAACPSLECALKHSAPVLAKVITADGAPPAVHAAAANAAGAELPALLAAAEEQRARLAANLASVRHKANAVCSKRAHAAQLRGAVARLGSQLQPP